ncbi:MAG: hypothetical protein EHM65_01975 [Acidobacteriales bacterium]|nr:MAG: hypothetical protein EHM65_01975 [Terriglobales bacterium]
MTLPATYAAAMLLTVLSLICMGSWANFFKLAKKERFELWYYDFAFGVLIAAGVAALTFGTLGSDGFVFLDDLMRAGKRNMAYALAAGVLLNLGNMLLLAAVSVLGMALAFPPGLGMALLAAVIFGYFSTPQGNPTLVFAGIAMVALAMIGAAAAHRSLSMIRELLKMKAGEHRTLRPSVSWKGVLISLVGGVLIGLIYPLLDAAKTGDTGLGPYGVGAWFCLGVFGSTMVYNLFFLNLPVQGRPLEILEYFRCRPRQHLLGLLGGLVWGGGIIASYVVAGTPPEILPSTSLNFALLQGAPLLSVLWGVCAWKELKDADAKVWGLMTLVFFLYLAGLVMLALAPFSLLV